MSGPDFRSERRRLSAISFDGKRIAISVAGFAAVMIIGAPFASSIATAVAAIWAVVIVNLLDASRRYIWNAPETLFDAERARADQLHERLLDRAKYQEIRDALGTSHSKCEWYYKRCGYEVFNLDDIHDLCTEMWQLFNKINDETLKHAYFVATEPRKFIPTGRAIEADDIPRVRMLLANARKVVERAMVAYPLRSVPE